MKSSRWSNEKLVLAIIIGLIVIQLFFFRENLAYVLKTTCSLLNREEAADIGRFIYRYEPKGFQSSVIFNFIGLLCPLFVVRPAVSGAAYALGDWLGVISAWIGIVLALSLLMSIVVLLKKAFLQKWESGLSDRVELFSLLLLAILSIYIQPMLLFVLIFASILMKANIWQRVGASALGSLIGIVILITGVV